MTRASCPGESGGECHAQPGDVIYERNGTTFHLSADLVQLLDALRETGGEEDGYCPDEFRP